MRTANSDSTFFIGAGFGARFGVSIIDWVILDAFAACDPFAPFEIVVDEDFRTADDGLEGGLSFFCGFDISAPDLNSELISFHAISFL